MYDIPSISSRYLLDGCASWVSRGSLVTVGRYIDALNTSEALKKINKENIFAMVKPENKNILQSIGIS